MVFTGALTHAPSLYLSWKDYGRRYRLSVPWISPEGLLEQDLTVYPQISRLQHLLKCSNRRWPVSVRKAMSCVYPARQRRAETEAAEEIWCGDLVVTMTGKMYFTFCSILEVFMYIIYFDPSQECCNIGRACIFTKPIFQTRKLML